MKRLFLLLLTFTSILSAAQSIPQVISSVASECSSLSTTRPVRFGVLPLMPTQDQYSSANAFGEYVTEQIGTELLMHSEKIRLFERQKLTAIAEELALSQTEMINAEQAIELGGVVPVDYLLTGSYTKLDDAISLTFRVLDVITGEIVLSKSDKTSSRGLTSLFQQANSSTVTPVEQKVVVTIDTSKQEAKIPECERDWWPQIKYALNDLSTHSAGDSVVVPAMRIPVDSACEHLHNAIVQQFSHHKVYNSDYTQYLSKQLGSVEYIDTIQYAKSFHRYLLQDSTNGQNHWELSKSLAQKSRYPEKYISPLLTNDDLCKEEWDSIEKRIIEIVQLIDKGELGKPLPLDNKSGFKFISNILKLSDFKSQTSLEEMAFKNRITSILYEKLQPQEWAKDLHNKLDKEYFLTLHCALDRSIHMNSQKTDELTKQLLQFWKNLTQNEKGANDYVYLLNHLNAQSINAKNSSAVRERYKAVYTKVVSSTKNEFGNLAPLITRSYIKNSAISISIKENIAINGFPTIDDLILKLNGNSNEGQLLSTV